MTSLPVSHLHHVLQVLLCVRLLRHQLGRLEVGLDEQVSVSGGVPVGAGDLHQAVAQQQHQQEQTPGVGRRDADGLQLVPEEEARHGRTQREEDSAEVVTLILAQNI